MVELGVVLFKCPRINISPKVDKLTNVRTFYHA